ncbi:MAG: histidine--tRNA ligase [Candidatus Eremiobacteraeota bacterium]|nr:histidine--tRNA ligase [Candidatus Eremiobacteraeota bacterium]MBC5827168.1 histidine--tRNA ligase [Candidatus Eremiobacteraeota bacterium]
MDKRTAPRGTFDILPTDSNRWLALERAVDELCARFGYGEIRTPIFESTDVFVRTIGEGTDIVDKEMYTFTDRGGRSMTLRPEFTAPTARAALEHNLLQNLPLKVYYRGPIFRYERPQKGRYRQSHQWGAECFGVAGPQADAEIIALGMELIRRETLADVELGINSMGCDVCRPAYREAVVAHLKDNATTLSENSRERLSRNPLRVLDSKDPSDRAVIATAPRVDSYLCDACREHFTAVRALLASMGITPTVDPKIVRGLDYYTRTVFEMSAGGLGTQNALCGGGRYDGLIAAMGGPATPAVGLAMGMERLLMAAGPRRAESLNGRPRTEVAFVALDEPSARSLVPILHAFRRAGISADMDYTLRKVDKQIRAAGQQGARVAVILGNDELARGEATVQDLTTRERQRVKLIELEHDVKERLAR